MIEWTAFRICFVKKTIQGKECEATKSDMLLYSLKRAGIPLINTKNEVKTCFAKQRCNCISTLLVRYARTLPTVLCAMHH